MSPTVSASPRRPALLALAIALLLAAPHPAAAQAYTWLVPAGGETWTAGTTHSLEWSGGPSGSPINVRLISLPSNLVVASVVNAMPYGFVTPWAIPGGLPAGQYQLYIEDTAVSTWTYGPVFTVQTPMPCLSGCLAFSIAPTYYSGYPGTSCGTTAALAMTNAQNAMSTALATACASGYAVSPSTLYVDHTYVPMGACAVGEFGAYQVESSAVGCCCPVATDAGRSTWGRVKTLYR